MIARADNSDLIIMLEMFDEIECAEAGAEDEETAEGHVKMIRVSEQCTTLSIGASPQLAVPHSSILYDNPEDQVSRR